jgi:hypothetical protein
MQLGDLLSLLCGLFGGIFFVFALFWIFGSCGLVVSFDQHSCNLMECFFDVLCSLGASFNILNFFMFFDKSLYVFDGDGSTVLEVALVTDKQYLRF